MPDNPQFLGALPPQEIADCISRSRGPSGDNQEYLFQLEDSLKSLGRDSSDEHVSDLVQRVKALGIKAESQEQREPEVQKIGSTNEQEEVEKHA